MTQAEVFVFVALSVGWVAIAAWTLRIARKVSRLDGAAANQPDSHQAG
jgi:hypothetical protein